MTADQLTQLILDAKSLFSKDWLKSYGLFFEREHIQRFSKGLIRFHENGVSDHLPLPHFSEEITPNLDTSYRFFESDISEIIDEKISNDIAITEKLVETIQNTPFNHILLIMGQRQTSATLKTIKGLPLKKQVLIDSSLSAFNSQISVGVRAWEKHTDRSEDAFWGNIKGTPQQKQNKVKQIITTLIEQHTWWNTFHHYKHEIVFEIRVESGHGMRWSYKDQLLIGFLEPFL
ncbi:hypothetical protein [uncultured Psychroserpens sp.]|uniref:hypothetical protein n=1 Tax=uncultured Psychroserpens sp. TaxID=255436 RepID=UPI00260C609E|nr:hypothetical protein [uncultured Psychroserpens sp.]